MKVVGIQPNKDGIIRIVNMVRPLSYGIPNGIPTAWAIIDPLDKTKPAANLIVIDDNSNIDPSLVPGYRITLVDEKHNKIVHLFEQQPKIALSL